jgi:uncharacterized protein (TIGR02453 family)
LFKGFGRGAFAFLDELEVTQERAWFVENKSVYEAECRGPMLDLLADLTARFAKEGPDLRADPRRSIFRIHRDVRFSRDKRPYKTHIGAVMTRDGGKDTPGLIYIHIDPRGCFAGAGFYRPEDAALAAIRQRIAAKPRAFKAMLAALEKSGLSLSADEDAMKRRPRGFEAVTDPGLVDAMCRRSFIVRLPLSEEAVAGAGLVDRIADFTQAALPLLTFGWQAIGHLPPAG